LTGAHPPFAFARRTAVALSAIAGLAALWGALARLGWAADAWSAREALWHGALAVLGFLGTMIAAERATALGRPWAFGAPIATGLGAIALLASPSPRSAQLLFLSGALVLVAIFAVVYRLQPALHNAVLGIGSLLWVVSIALWFGGFPLYRVAPWWAGMLVATIVGERLELSRLVGLSPRARGSFVAGIAVHVGGLVLSVAWFGWGVRVAGLGLVALAAWLVRHDAARRTIHGPPLPRFMAACLLSGYLWLAAGGAAWAWFGGVIAGPGHDAMLHAVFVGFVMSMVFAHAPVILPAVLGGSVEYRPRFYAHLALLHASLVVRILGDLVGAEEAVRWGGLLGAAAILVFVVSTATARLGKPLARPIPLDGGGRSPRHRGLRSVAPGRADGGRAP